MNRYLFALLLILTACSSTPVRSTVDSFGEQAIDPKTVLYFAKDGLSLLEKQAANSCSEAAQGQHLETSATFCPNCLKVVLQARMAGTQQVLRSSPG